MKQKVCLYCKRLFSKRWNYSANYWATQKFCGKKCADASLKGKQRPRELMNKIHASILGHNVSVQTREKLRRANIGKHHSEETKQKIREKRALQKASWKGRHHSVETKKKISMHHTNSVIFGGFRTSISERIRRSPDYINWRLMVFGRDDFTCQICGVRGTYLHAHHIKSFAEYPELRFDVKNGKTLCKICHQNVHRKVVYAL